MSGGKTEKEGSREWIRRGEKGRNEIIEKEGGKNGKEMEERIDND